MSQPTNGKNPSIKGQELRNPRILVAPLDWGLGHATRCIPLIRELLAADFDVWIGAEGAQESLLKEEFPNLTYLPLIGYRAKYSRTKIGLIWQMLIQSPKFIKVIKKEHAWLKKEVSEKNIDLVLSDNRYGLWHPSIPTIFMTHQLTIKSPLGKWSERFLQKRNYQLIDKFNECWIPDNSDNGLAGDLSHPIRLPKIPVRYIGPLCRFQKKNIEERKKHLLVILSGPEPQRTILENKIIAQISNYIGTATIVRGLPGEHSVIPSTNMLRFYNHLPAEILNEEMLKAEFIISRSGYSSVMDIAALQKKSILIPTPGQTEQEYLAAYLSAKQFALTTQQEGFSLEQSLNLAEKFPYQFNFKIAGNLEASIRSLLQLKAMPS